MQPVVEVSSVACSHGTRRILEGVDLRLEPGQVLGVLGPRWAGKTTLLRLLGGELEPCDGRICRPEREVLIGDDGRSPIEERLDPATRRRVALARGVAAAPDLLLLDEPAAGFDADTVAVTRSLVQRFAAQGGAVVWATRRLSSLSGVATGVILLSAGRVRYRGSAEALADRALGGVVTGLRRVA
jgi:ABC-type multidrug transport system ATPase subunit